MAGDGEKKTKMTASQIEFCILGSYYPGNPSAITEAQMQVWKDEGNVRDTAAQLAILAKRFQKKSQPEILGPAPAPLTRLRDMYRWQILLKGEKLELLHGFMHSLGGEIASLGKGGKVRISVDVDPEYMM